MSKTKIRVGIVGAGPIGGLGRRPNSHAAGYRRCEEAELVAVADINPERLQQFGDEWDIAPEHRYPTAVDMYEKANLDVVSVTTHNLYHHQPVIEAAEACIKVIMVEKPLAISVAWGRKMVEACARSGSRLITEHTRRFLPHYRKIRKMIDEGAVGDVRTITYSATYQLGAVAELVHVLEQGGELVSPGREARKALEIMLAMLKSHERGSGHVDLPLS